MSTPTNFSELVNVFLELLEITLPVIIGMAVLVFLWGLAKFIFRVDGDEKAVADGKKLITWGLIALFVLVSIMAILMFVYGDIGFSEPFGRVILPEK